MSSTNIGYHYCSVETFHKIIKSGNLRLSSVKYLNDYLEFKVFDEVILHYMAESEKKIGFEDSYLMDLKNYHTSHFGKSHPLLSSQCIPFLTSFSKKGDDLSQWRAYGDDGKGVAIKFDLKAIRDRTLGLITEENPYQFNQADVLYYKQDTFQGTIDKVLDKGRTTEFANVSDLHAWLNAVGANIKPYGFFGEEEIRFTYIPTYRYDLREATPRTYINGVFPSVNFQSHNGCIKPYFELPFQQDDFLGLVLGPNCKLDSDDLDWFLKGCENISGSRTKRIQYVPSDLSYRQT